MPAPSSQWQLEFTREFEPGSVLFHEGETGVVMYVIQSGYVRITKKVSGGDRVLATLGPGEFLGEMSLLSGHPRTASAQVTEAAPAKVLELDAPTFERLVTSNAEIAIRLMRKLASRLDSADALIEILLLNDPRARVMRALIRHARSFGVASPEGTIVALSPNDIATQVNAEPIVVEEVLASLEHGEVITRKGDHLLIEDIERLYDFLDFMETFEGIN
jgi:CRP-like cAMP-binding protein